MSSKLHLILGAPGEAEMPLLADLGVRADVALLGVIDPGGMCLGGAIAEIMGLPVVRSFDQLNLNGGPTPRVVLPVGPPGIRAELKRLADSAGLETILPARLQAELHQERPHASRFPLGAAARDAAELRAVELESEALQASLDDLENVLAGDAILRRLVGMCSRAVGASGGSLMLFDETSAELFIAHAVGLSEGTIHGTRVKLGEGIAGGVAHERRSRLVEGQHGPVTRRRDRPDIASAICSPLVHDGDLLGVLNVSTRRGEPGLDQASLKVVEQLAVRFGRILAEVLALQRQRTSRLFQLTEQQLRRQASDHDDLPSVLEAWTTVLSLTAEAGRVSLVVPCEDGSLLVAEGTPDGQPQHWYESPQNPAWMEVLGSGVPLVARQDSLVTGDREPVTIFYLPIGRDPVRAGLAVHFAGSHLVHAFHSLAGEAAFLLERLLPDLIDRRCQQHRVEKLATLSTVMATLNVDEGTRASKIETLCETARALTHARHAVAVAELDGDDAIRLAGGNAPTDVAWLEECSRLLRAASAEGWRISTFEKGATALSVLVACSSAGDPAPALIMVDKDRAHPLDSRVFTPLDAEIVRTLAEFLPHILIGNRNNDPLVIESEVTNPLAGLAHLRGTGEQRERADQATRFADAEARLLDDLAREMDRCDRYHNVFGLVMLSPSLPVEMALPLLEEVTHHLRARLRASDRIYTLAGGELALLIPEDVRALRSLQARLVNDLRELAGDATLGVSSARAAYPSLKGPAEAFLAAVRSRLED